MSWFKQLISRVGGKSEDVAADDVAPTEIEQPKPLQEGLRKTRSFWGEGLKRLLWGKKSLDPALLEELENCLLSADVGVNMTSYLLEPLVQGLKHNEVQDGERVLALLKSRLIERLEPLCVPLVAPAGASPFVVLLVGVNGAGKTTTMAKLARRWQLDGKKVLMAAGDTFRAAAVEQLQRWGDRYHIPVVAQGTGADSAAVIYDACQSAKAKGIDIVLADTAGRLHTQGQLMDELKKIKRVLGKLDAALPQETLLVLDAGIGQNAINQVQQFHDAIGITGLALTKLDGTAKGGVVFALSEKYSIPLRYIGIGEAIDDLRPFEAKAFVEAVLNDDSV